MQFWRAVNLTPKKLEALIHQLDWADHYEICRVEYKKPAKHVRTMTFQTGDHFIKEYVLPKGIEIEQGAEKISFLSLPIIEPVIEEGEPNDFKVIDVTEESAKVAVGLIAWHLLKKGSGPVAVYSEKYSEPEKGVSTRLFHQEDVALLEELLACGLRVGYQDFDWTPYQPA